jgi:hypothetical protein
MFVVFVMVGTLRRTLRTVAFTVFLLIFAIVNQVWAGPYDPPVGGVLNPINLMMTLLVPVLVVIGILGVMVLFGWTRIKTRRDEKKV